MWSGVEWCGIEWCVVWCGVVCINVEALVYYSKFKLCTLQIGFAQSVCKTLHKGSVQK